MTPRNWKPSVDEKDGWGGRWPIPNWEPESLPPWNRPSCKVVTPERTIETIDYEEGFREAVSAAYANKGIEIVLVEPGRRDLVFVVGQDGGLRTHGRAGRDDESGERMTSFLRQMPMTGYKSGRESE